MEAFRRGLRWAGWIAAAIPFFVAMGAFRLIGLDAASATGGWLARKLAPLAPAHKTARKNLVAAFPDLSDAEIDRILEGMWDNLGRTFGEYPHLGRFAGYPNPRVAISGQDHAHAALREGKGVVMVSGHFANWEVMALSARQAGFEGLAIYRVVNNPTINWWIVRQRRRYGYVQQVPKAAREGVREMLKTLKQNKVVVMLADQRSREGVAVPFFGRDAMTVVGPAVLAMRTGAALIPTVIRRTQGAHFELDVLPPIERPHTGNNDADTAALLGEVNAFLEQAIRREPTQWLWAHNRWKMARRVPAPSEPTPA